MNSPIQRDENGSKLSLIFYFSFLFNKLNLALQIHIHAHTHHKQVGKFARNPLNMIEDNYSGNSLGHLCK